MELKEFYTISEVEEQTGFTSLRIRTWENRFSLLKPLRTSTNIRRYRPEDVKKLLLIKDLLEKGFTISTLANKTIEELSHQLRAFNTETENIPSFGRFMLSLRNLDEEMFHAAFDELALTMSFEKIMENVLFPLLSRVDELWINAGLPVCKEQFLANLVRQKVVSKIEEQRPKSRKNTTILFAPEQKQHEIGLLFTNHTLRKNKFHCIYLGTGIDIHAIKDIIGNTSFSNMVTIATTVTNLKEPEAFFKLISNYGKKARVYVIGDSTIYKSKYIHWNDSYKTVLQQLGF